MAIWPVAEAGWESSRFQQDRSPVGHQLDAPRQLASGGLALGSCEQGAANQLNEVSTRLPAGSLPNSHNPVEQPAPPPAAQVPVENPAWLTNSMVTSRASKAPPFKQMPPPPANPEPLK